ncbi:Gfo/Idh/MocA family oxidoreductase [uncultured Parvibaculum sp.]|uniref:Gfo/Idh/MocA family protein n=1 Tax=uncultured Parvibaculum sp. TaxID=291828 RepID=UPI0030EE37E9|tara:strand:+ start:66476 stop:67414 length:939 start_codon:yes stop_codon:yes gene_type:complete
MTGGAMHLGLVGVGDWGRHILRDLKALGAEVHAVARSDASIARARAGGAAAIVATADALPDCSGYIVASDTTAHLDAVEQLLPRGRPIYVEKPLASDLERIRRLPDAARDLVFTMHKWRYHPGIVELARIAATQEFGPVIGLRSFRMGWENHHRDVDAVWVLLPHDMSIALHLLGEVPAAIAAWKDPTVAGQDGLIAHCRTAGGVPVVIEVSAGKPNKHRAVVLACRDAVCELDDTQYDRIVIRRRNTLQADPFEERQVAADMPLKAEIAAFLHHLRGGPAPFTALGDETAIVAAISQLRQLAFGASCALPS